MRLRVVTTLKRLPVRVVLRWFMDGHIDTVKWLFWDDDRFMICCDGCEDWFHGSCVGVSKQLGKEIQRTQQQWQCPKCSKGTRSILAQLQQRYSLDSDTSAARVLN